MAEQRQRECRSPEAEIVHLGEKAMRYLEWSSKLPPSHTKLAAVSSKLFFRTLCRLFSDLGCPAKGHLLD